MDVHGKRIVVTGAAGGIGAAGVQHLESLGARVIGLDVVAGPGVREVDLTDAAATADVLRAAAADLGGLDVLWLNAGVMTRARNEDPMGDPLATLTAASYRRVFDVNVGANVTAIGAALPLLDGDGDIVVTASAAGVEPFAPDPIYTASKHAVIGLVRSLGIVLEGSGVRIHAVCPGGTDTPMAGTVLDRSMLQAPTAVAECVVALLAAGDNGDAWTALPERPPVHLRFPVLRGKGFKLD